MILKPVAGFRVRRISPHLSTMFLVASGVLISLHVFSSSLIPSLLAVPVFAASGYFAFWGFAFPRIYPGWGKMSAALVLTGGLVFVVFTKKTYEWIWRNAFQITDDMSLFQDPGGKWSVSYPSLWTQDQQETGDSVTHVFRPSDPAPALFFTATARPSTGAKNLEAVVENFINALPKEKSVNVQEREFFTLPSGHKAYRMVYGEVSEKLPIKNELLFVMPEKTLYFLAVGGSPKWFDRHRTYLEKLLFSLKINE